MFRRLPLLILLSLTLLALPIVAQEDDALTVGESEIVARQDVYGQALLAIEGQITNAGADAYTGISLFAQGYDADGERNAEGIGYLVNACGAGLLPDFTMQPGATHAFDIPLELYTPDAQVARFEILTQATAIDAAAVDNAPVPGITQVSDQEVVQVEWLDTRALRYGVGCPRDQFYELDWYQYSSRTETTLPVRHPREADVTPELLTRLGLTDETLIDNAALVFSPQGERLVYQGDVNRFYTAQPDGSFIRMLYNDMYNRTLQDILWLDDGRFLATYFGAYGDPVLYFTADDNSRPISLNPINSIPSQIIPGASPDGRRAIIGGTFGDMTGYFLKALTNNSDPQLLFEAEPPGNNYPPPLFTVTPPAGDSAASDEIVYLARDVDGETRLQCFHLVQGGPVDLAPLPLRLSTDERARWWRSPDGATIALGATGVNGGLWLIDLAAFPACAAS